MIRGLKRLVEDAPGWLQVILGMLAAISLVAPVVIIAAALRKSPRADAFHLSQWQLAMSGCPVDCAWAGDAAGLENANRSCLQSMVDCVQFATLLRLKRGDALEAHAELAYQHITNSMDELGRGQYQINALQVKSILLGERRGLMKVAELQSDLELVAGEYLDALKDSARALQIADDIGASRLAPALTRVTILTRLGAMRQAMETLDSIDSRSLDLCDLTLLYLKRAETLDQMFDRDEDDAALSMLKIADAYRLRCPAETTTGLQIALNRANLICQRDPDAALADLAYVERVEPGNFDVKLQRACPEVRKNNLASAEQTLKRAEQARIPDVDWRWQLAETEGNIAELKGDFYNAEIDYRRAMTLIAGLRALAKSKSGYVVSSHRGPYDDLFAMYASQRRWSDALEVIFELDASDMLHANDVEGLGADSASLANSKISSQQVQAAIDAWRGLDLVIVVAPSTPPAGEPHPAYRLRVQGGQVEGEQIGPAHELKRTTRVLKSSVFNRQAAAYLGQAIVPQGTEREPLYVLGVGIMSNVELSALLDRDGNRMMDRRPLLHVQSLRSRTSAAAGTGQTVVFADTDPDRPLAAASREGKLVAQALGPETALYESSAATHARLLEARDAKIIYVAGHTIVSDDGRWHVLPMGGDEVSPPQLVRDHIAPQIAVLASCESAVGDDEESWSSITAALVQNGTRFVISTDQLVNDDAAFELMAEFAKQSDAFTAPAHALAQAQHAVISRSDALKLKSFYPSWMAFSVMARPPMVMPSN